jgi:hypothetical protein
MVLAPASATVPTMRFDALFIDVMKSFIAFLVLFFSYILYIIIILSSLSSSLSDGGMWFEMVVLFDINRSFSIFPEQTTCSCAQFSRELCERKNGAFQKITVGTGG